MFALYLLLSISTSIKRTRVKKTLDEDPYTPHDPMRQLSANIDIKHCLFSDHQVSGEDGGAILIASKTGLFNCSIDDCIFSQCSSNNGGAISINFAGKNYFEFIVTNSVFSECTAKTNGGGVFIKSGQSEFHSFKIQGCKFNNSKAANGGGLYAELRDQLELERCQFNNNEASTQGSSAYLRLGHNDLPNGKEEHDIFNIHNNEFVFNPNSNNMCNVYIDSKKITGAGDLPHANVNFGKNTFNLVNPTPSVADYLHLKVFENEGGFESFKFDSCNCVHQAESTVQISSNIKLSNFNFGCTSIDQCKSDQPVGPENPDTEGYTPHDPIRQLSANIDIKHCLFSDHQVSGENGGAILIASKTGLFNCSIDDCMFIRCSATNGGAIYISFIDKKYYEFIVTNSVFSECTAKTNGGGVFIKSGQSEFHTFRIQGCKFNNNKATKGGGLYADLRDKLNLENCQFNNNEATTQGSSAYLSLGFNNPANEGEEHDTFDIHSNVFVFNPSSTNKVNLYISNKKITDTTVDQAHVNVNFGHNTFNLVDPTTTFTGYHHLEIVELEGGYEKFEFDVCNCVFQEQSTVSVAEAIVLQNINFGCTSLDTCKSNVATPTPLPTADTDGYIPLEPIRLTTSNIKLDKCKFTKFDNLENNGGAILITYNKKVNCLVNDCKFTECKAANGGAIFAQYSENTNYQFSATNCIFTSCEAQFNGGAVYLQSAQTEVHTFSIKGCTFNNNKAANGGGLYAELRDQLELENSQFNNNEASTQGSSAYFKLGHQNIKDSGEEHDIFNINKNVFIFNPSSTNSINVYIENDNITDVKDPAHANVNFGGNTFDLGSPTTSTEYHHLEVVETNGGFESFKFNACNCVHQEEKTVQISSNIKLSNFNFGCTSIDQCKSDQPVDPVEPSDDFDYKEHEPIKESTANIVVSESKFTAMGISSNDGGAILIKSSKVNCSITNSKFQKCKAKNGGAIYASYSGTNNYTFKITQAIFTDCFANEKGGAVCLFNTQPLRHIFDINGCTFSNSRASSYGGGLYAELRDQLNIEGCKFIGNQANTKGSSAYLKLGHENIKNTVEEHDIFNIHNNEFIFSPSDSNSINIYIENDQINDEEDPPHVNVYLGGCTFSVDNHRSVKSDEFLHLEINENEGGFESFTIDSCNCVQQGKETIKLLPNMDTSNFIFECSSIDQCSPPGEEQPQSKSKSKTVGIAVGVSVAAVVVIAVVVVVVIFVIRKKREGNYADAKTEDIADDVNESGIANTADFNNQEGSI